MSYSEHGDRRRRRQPGASGACCKGAAIVGEPLAGHRGASSGTGRNAARGGFQGSGDADCGRARRRSHDEPDPAERRGAAACSIASERVSRSRGGRLAMNQMERLYLDDLRVGQRFTSGSYVMEAARIKEFAAEFDPQPFHLEEAAAEVSIFKGLAASGWHTAAVAMRLLVTGGLPFANGIVGLGGEIAWPRPTRPGDILHVESEIVEITPSRSKPHQGIVIVRGTMFNQNGEPVYLLTAKLLVLRRRDARSV